jgi:3-oxoacyl-[acyl-carrier protein] reductase
MINPGLRDRTALITGANNPNGIGACAALAFAEVGARVVLHFFRSHMTVSPLDVPSEAFYLAQQAKDCSDTVQRIEAMGGAVHTLEEDFAEIEDVSRLFDEAERAAGSIDVMINNAATWSADTFVPSGGVRHSLLELWTDAPDSITRETAIRQFAVNACVPALLMREFASRHATRGKNWGRIVNISTAGADCFPSEASYGASKSALESYTLTAAWELAQFGITVNVLALGPVQTGWITKQLEQAILPTIPLGRIGTPRDVADVVVFFASEQARWVTGQRVFVSGGHRM